MHLYDLLINKDSNTTFENVFELEREADFESKPQKPTREQNEKKLIEINRREAHLTTD